MSAAYERETARVNHLCASAALHASRRALITAIQWSDAQTVAMLRTQVAEYDKEAEQALDAYCAMLEANATVLGL